MTSNLLHSNSSSQQGPSDLEQLPILYIEMGKSISVIRDAVKAGDEAAKAESKEQLDFLVNTVDAKLDHYQAILEAAFTDPCSIVKRQVPGIRAVRWSREYQVDVSDTPSDYIEKAIDLFFGTGCGGPDVGDVITGFKLLVKAALNIFLGNTEAGEQEDIQFFVFMQHNAFVRIDLMMWRYNFIGQGVMTNRENVFGGLICLSVVDHSALKLDELVYLLSEYTCDNTTAVEKYVDRLVSLYKKVKQLPSSNSDGC